MPPTTPRDSSNQTSRTSPPARLSRGAVTWPCRAPTCTACCASNAPTPARPESLLRENEQELHLAGVAHGGGATGGVVDAVVRERDGQRAVHLDVGAVALGADRDRDVLRDPVERQSAGGLDGDGH